MNARRRVFSHRHRVLDRHNCSNMLREESGLTGTSRAYP